MSTFLSIQNDAPLGIVSQGDTVNYTITFTSGNTTFPTGTSFTLSDVVPPTLLDVYFTVNSVNANVVNQGANINDLITVVNGDFPFFVSYNVSATVSQNAECNEQINYTVNTELNQLPFTESSTTDALLVYCSPELSLEGPTEVCPQGVATYQVSLNLTSTPNGFFEINNVLPPVLSSPSFAINVTPGISTSSSLNGNTLTVLGTFTGATGGNVTIDISGLTPSDSCFTGPITDFADATVIDGSIQGLVFSSTASFDTQSICPLLTISKTGPATSYVNDPVLYVLTATNSGDCSVENVSIYDVVPTTVTNVTWSSVTQGGATIDSGSSGSGNTILTVADMPAGSTVTLLIRGIASTCHCYIDNSASLSYLDRVRYSNIVSTRVYERKRC